jgi:starch synthase
MLAVADVFVLSSLYEPLGIVVLEGMAAGLPVVAASVGGVPELIDNGVNGLLVPPGNPGELAAALADLLSHPERAHAMGSAARVIAKEFSMQAMTERYFNLYEELSTARKLA